MKPHNSFSPKRQEAGVALLISIFILLLVSGVALALVANSGSESSLAGNFRSSTSAYDAGFAGLEEARGRLLPGSRNYFNNTVAGFMPVGAPLAVVPQVQVRYILNPLNPADVVAPTTAGSPYADTEFQQEWGTPVAGAAVQTINSVWANSAVAQMPGPLYKWVRITPATEQSLNIDVNGDGVKDPVTPLYYDSSHIDANGNPRASLILVPTAPVGVPATASQVFEVTSLVSLPNGSKKMEQYVVTPFTFNLNLDSPLTIPGTVGSFSGGNSANYQINGHDGQGNAPAVAGCNPNSAGGPSVAVSNSGSATTVGNGEPRPANYTGTNCSYSVPGCVGNASLPNSMSSPAQLEQTLQTVAQNSDVCLAATQAAATAASCANPTIATPGANGYSFSQISGALPGGTWPNAATNPQVVYVDGDLDISGNNPGSGVLVVTGNLTYDGNSSWNGIILVIGQGTTTFNTQFNVNGGGSGQFNGAIFVATITHNGNGSILPNFGTSDFNVNGGGGSGVFYNSCWIKNAQKPTTYQVLSFHEIAQ